MWTIPEVYTTIPTVNVNDFHWYTVSFVTFNRLHNILNILKESCTDNILWIPTHAEYKRLRTYSNQVVSIDKLNYPNYGFIGVIPQCSNIKELVQEIHARNYAKVLPGHVFPDEITQAIKVAYKLNSNKSKPKYAKGDSVMITSGACFGMIAKVLRVDKAKVTLSLELGNNVVQIETFITDIAEVQ